MVSNNNDKSYAQRAVESVKNAASTTADKVQSVGESAAECSKSVSLVVVDLTGETFSSANANSCSRYVADAGVGVD